MKLWTAKEVADELAVKESTVPRLGLPVVRIGRGRGLLRYRREDVEAYVARRTEYASHKGAENVREKKKRRIVGLSVLPSRELLQKVRLSNSGGRQGSGNPV